ncbi:protein phosphatase 2C domain-containing protein [Sphingomonas sp. 179-A 2A2 NHS]|uniref:protein phosphatase 2C domain-containing protein n=1 Tax=Sphingomonas sp. 179-A 2A2 NHS TaxID=3374290 RepID=UPI0038798204
MRAIANGIKVVVRSAEPRQTAQEGNRPLLKVNVAKSDGPGPVNEDVVGHCPGAAWVIDGATGVGAALLEAPSDAAWLANMADAELRSVLIQSPDTPTRDLVRSVIERCRDALGRHALREPDGSHEHPSAAFAMVRVMDGGVEFATLADCRIAYTGEDGNAQLFGTTALGAIEGKTIALVERIIDLHPGITPAELKEAVLPQLRENRRLMNKPDGYWVLGTEPAAAEHLDVMRMPVDAGRRFAIASDGYLRLVELFAVATPHDLLAIDDDEAFAKWLYTLRDLERTEGSCRRYPRVKVHDDASFLHCEFQGEG